MRRFRRAIDDLCVQELHLHGRRFTWSSERSAPTLERIDRAFADGDWLDAFPNHLLKALSTDCSDHSPLLLKLNVEPWCKPRYQFEAFWVKMDGFLDVVKQTWEEPVPEADCCRLLDQKLRRTAKALQSWSMKSVGSVRQQLYMSRQIVAQLDSAQDNRTLTAEEAELRKSLKMQSLALASLARTIARQRSRVRYLREGDANTKYFHLQACHRKRKSYIEGIMHDGVWFTEEEAKSDIVYEYYNSLLGKPFIREHDIDLTGLLPQLNLAGIDCCFLEAEVWAAIKDSPPDRAPGPDGFTGAFYRAAWEIIKGDVLAAFHALWALDTRSFYLLNGALMILLRKTQEPSGLNDYRPISLMHSFGKLFAKCLARRLSPKLKEIVATNQSAFIKGRVIHDNFRAVQLACRLLNSKRVPSMLLKVDIRKAFDSVAWPFLLAVLQHIGFPRRWINWVSLILSSASTRVLVNSRAGRRITHARGLRQGDPISPMLFVIVMEVLNSIVREADRVGALTPLPGTLIAHRASLYADDVVLLLAPTVADFTFLSEALRVFAGTSGLVTNVDKCLATPIRCTDEMIAQVQQVFPCVVALFPCKYLGIPLSLRKLRRVDEQAIVDKVQARIPTWKAGLLNETGRLVLVKSTLTALPTHISIACCLSEWAIQHIDRSRRAFLWAGSQVVSGGKCRVAWRSVCRPLRLGGLGLLDLRYFGFALRLRWEWLARAEPDRCWASLPARCERSVAAMRDANISVVVGDGVSTRLWTDNWCSVGRLSVFAPYLFQTLSWCAKRRSLAEALPANRWARDIRGAPTTQVLCDFLRVWAVLQSVQLNPLQPDRFMWRWTPDGSFSVSSCYLGASTLPGARELWKSKAIPKVKYFFWLALHRRIWTSDRRKRHGLQDCDDCALCAQHPETVEHLLLSCVYSRQLWWLVLSPCHLQDLTPSGSMDLPSWWLQQRERVAAADRALFDSIVLLTTWMLWKERNNRVFQRESKQPHQVFSSLIDEASDWASAGIQTMVQLSLILSQNGVPV